MFFNYRERYAANRAYALGRQDIQQYKERLDCTQADNQSYLNLDWSILPIIPKFVKIVVGKIMESTYGVSVDAIDPLAMEIKKEIESKLKAKALHQGFLSTMKEYLGEAYSGEESLQVDMDFAEAEMYMKTDHKLMFEIEMEDALKLYFHRNNYEQIRKEVVFDHVTLGVGGIKQWVDNFGTIKQRRVNPFLFISDFSRKEDFSDIRHAGEIIPMTINELREDAGEQFTEEEYKDIEKNARRGWSSDLGVDHNHYQNMYGSEPFANNKILVLDAELFTYDALHWEAKINAHGNRVVYNQKPSKKEGTTGYNRRVQKIYAGKLIIGTEYMYDWGPRTNQPRSRNTIHKTSLSYHMFAPGMIDGQGISLVEEARPLADSSHLAWRKLQDQIANSISDVMAINYDAMEDIVFDNAGKRLHPKDLLDLLFSKGIMFYSGKSIEGHNMPRPVDVYPTSMLDSAGKIIGLMDKFMDFIRWTTGINEVADASTPNPNMLNGVADKALAATNRVLFEYFHGDKSLLISVGEQMTKLVGMVARNNPDDIKGALGETSVGFLKEYATRMSVHDYGLILDKKADEEDWYQFLSMAQESMKAGQITLAHFTKVKELRDNMKKANQYLLLCIEKREAKMAEQEQAAMEANAQSQQQSAQMAAEMKAQQVMAEADAKIKIEQAKHELAMQMAEIAHKYKLEEIEAMNTGKLEAAQITSETDKEIAEGRYAQERYKADKDEEKQQVDRPFRGTSPQVQRTA
jgi:hypothetical protein